MNPCHIDHLTITAPNLEMGADFVYRKLGVKPQSGGKHQRMGTHNLLLQLGPTIFLEVISADPEAADPKRPRWFGLDNRQLTEIPKLSAWVARCSDIQNKIIHSTEDLGLIEPMSRGSLNWLITIPADGNIPLEGAAPILIEWQTDFHPASALQETGISLQKLEIHHPEPQRIITLLSSINIEEPISILETSQNEQPFLAAYFDTPSGVRQL